MKRHPLRKAQPSRNVELEIRALAFGGEGVGSVEGKACFVEGTLPGETVIARVTQDKKRFMRAKLLKVVEASAARVEPPCPFVENCGGCQYQHIAYAEELRLKEAQVREAFQRAFGLPGDAVRSIRRGARDYRYRNSVTLHAAGRGPKGSGPGAPAFVGRDNRTLVPVTDCLLVDERLRGAFTPPLRPGRGADKATFRLDSQGHAVSDHDDRFLRVNVAGEEFVAHSRGFFQNNLEVTADLAAVLAEWVARTAPEVFYDLYGGVGTFGFLAARGVPRLVCIEEHPGSLQALRMNRSEKGRSASLEIVEGSVEKAFPLVWRRPDRAGRSFICLDPPRAGLDGALCRFLEEQVDAAAIAYVACDLPCLVRDLGVLLERGRYGVREVVPFDMFPRTKHIEVAVLLERRSAS